MNLVELTEYLVKSIVKNPEKITVKMEDESTILISVDKEDISSVIGSDGRMANAIRTIIQSSSYVLNKKNIRINIDTL